jgi:cellulose synthase/poly-beta-1,6-N-acetylglucosamine synthase-like glycosyltransferase
MMPSWALAVLVFGANFTVWGVIGLLRLADALVGWVRGRGRPKPLPAEPVRRRAPVMPGEPGRPAIRAHPAEAMTQPLRALPAADTVALLEAAQRILDGKTDSPGQPGQSPQRHPAEALTQPLKVLPVDRGAASDDLAGSLGALVAARSSTDKVLVMRDGLARPPARRGRLTVKDVAILMPAHNEGMVLEDSLRAAMQLVPRANIHVVSDGSTDDTFEIAASVGVNVIKTRKNVGKAGALQEAIQRFQIVERFPVVMLLDADTRVQPGYFNAALPLFDDPQVVAVAGCVRTARDRKLSITGNILVGHRMRIYAIGQRVLKFGQTWRAANATHIVPGFASVYRTDVLPKIEMNPPGLAIEDFNMTFEVYQKRLGKVGFSMAAVAVTQDPDNVRDYVRQTKRWALGLWQTVRRHPPRANLFTLMLTLLLIELVTASLLFLLLPLVLVILLIPNVDPAALFWPGFGSLHTFVAAHMNMHTIVFGVALPDYAMTCLVALLERRARLLLLGLFFPILRVIDSVIGLYAIPLAWLATSNGKWKSPARRGMPARQRTGTQIPAASGTPVPDEAGDVAS